MARQESSISSTLCRTFEQSPVTSSRHSIRWSTARATAAIMLAMDPTSTTFEMIGLVRPAPQLELPRSEHTDRVEMTDRPCQMPFNTVVSAAETVSTCKFRIAWPKGRFRRRRPCYRSSPRMIDVGVPVYLLPATILVAAAGQRVAARRKRGRKPAPFQCKL